MSRQIGETHISILRSDQFHGETFGAFKITDHRTVDPDVLGLFPLGRRFLAENAVAFTHRSHLDELSLALIGNPRRAMNRSGRHLYSRGFSITRLEGSR